MSSLRQKYGEDYPDAAEKHLNDANVLLNSGRYDGAAYLSGYIVECCLKSLIQCENRQLSKDHWSSSLYSTAMRLCSQSNSKTAKYVSRPEIRDLLQCQITNWQTHLRYKPEGTLSQTDAQKWRDEARAVFTSSIIQMRLDGVI